MINKYKLTFKEYTLDNGLNVILVKNTSIPYFALNLSFHVGSKNEEPGTRGFAHLFEHLMFTGSKHMKEDEYDMYCNLAGGDNSAYTTEDKTSYFIMLPSHQIELALWLESDRLLEFSVTQDKLDTQRDVVIEEKYQSYDNKPFGTVVLEIAKRLFKNSYSWTPIGYEEDIKNANLKIAKNFYTRFYVPENAVLCISGDINTRKTLELVKKYFGDIPAGNKVNFIYNECKLDSEIRETIYDNIKLPGIFISYKIPGELTDDFYKLNVISYILADGDSSRLYNNLIYKENIAFETDCFSEGFEHAGIFSLYALLQPNNNVEEAELKMNNIIEEIKNGNISDTDVTKAINKIESRFFQRRQTNSNLADYLVHYKMIHNNTSLINNIMSKYYDLTKEELIKTANKYLNKNNRVILQYLPRN